MQTRYLAIAGLGFDKVVRISSGASYGTGILVFEGRALQTAAHLLAASTGALCVEFQTKLGSETLLFYWVSLTQLEGVLARMW